MYRRRVHDREPPRWPLPAAKGIALVPVSGRLAFSSHAMARAAVLAGLGIAIFPEFACAEDLRRKRLVAVLDDAAVDVGAVWLVYAARRFLPARVRAFVDLTQRRHRLGPTGEGDPTRGPRGSRWLDCSQHVDLPFAPEAARKLNPAFLTS